VIEQRAVVRFLTLKKLSAMDITAILEGVYEHEAVVFSALKKWCKWCVGGRILLKDDLRSRGLP
jgi:hypothetical protein